MRNDDYEEIINDLFRLRDAVENQSITKKIKEMVEDRLLFLDATIDAMPAEKSEHDLKIIGIAYHYYRLKATYIIIDL